MGEGVRGGGLQEGGAAGVCDGPAPRPARPRALPSVPRPTCRAATGRALQNACVQRHRPASLPPPPHAPALPSAGGAAPTNAASATSTARPRAAALFTVSSYSASGTESATTPAPAWM